MKTIRNAITWVGAFLWASVLWSAQVTVTPTQYAPGGYSTIVWSGVAPCVKSSSPAYGVWDGDPDVSGGRSVAPDVSTVFRLACADGTATATLTVGDTPPPVATPTGQGRAPACYPDIALPLKVRTVTIPTLSNGDNRLSLWTCRTASGYVNERWSWSVAEIAPWFEQALGGMLDEASARSYAVANSGGADRASSAALDEFAARAVVAVNGTSTTRPVYPLNADGTRGATAVAGVRVAVGSPCDITRRVGTSNYYAVAGGVTLCKFTAPAGINE